MRHVLSQLIVSTLLLGGIYALIAVGLTLIFGVMRVVNFAHGEFLMLGMYLAFWAFALLHLDPYMTLVLSLPLIFGFGWLSYRMVMRPVIHASHNVQIFTTVGLSIALQNVALVLWTADSQFVRTGYYAVVVRLGNAVLNLAQLIAFAVAVLCTAALFAFLRWSYTGKVMRATAQDRAVASLMGIDTGRVFALTWAVGITCVGVAGGVHDQSRQVDTARRVGSAEVAARSAAPILPAPRGPFPVRRASVERRAVRPCT